MRIEIDTKHDTKEELGHLAKMLMAMSGGQISKQKHTDIFNDNSTPSGGLFSMFNDPQPAQAPSQPMETGMLSMLDTPSTNTEPEEKKDIVDGLRMVPY